MTAILYVTTDFYGASYFKDCSKEERKKILEKANENLGKDTFIYLNDVELIVTLYKFKTIDPEFLKFLNEIKDENESIHTDWFDVTGEI